jgi:lipopolysaccharide assembly outer membrane protein LptD (OstA)
LALQIHRFPAKILLKPLHTNLFNIVLSAIFLTIGAAKTHAQEPVIKPVAAPVIKTPDTIPVSPGDLTIIPETPAKNGDSIKPKKPLLTDKIKYRAEEYARIDQKNKTITLHDRAELYYQDIELKAGIIVMDYEKNEVYAGRLKDSTGNYVQLPVFKQGNNVVEPDSIRFNFKTKKALVWNSRTNQGDFVVKAEITKRENDSVYYMKGARFTTAKDIENPEYYFWTRKVKFVPGKKVVVGFTNMVIADVPTPIALPFAFFPMSQKATSGILVPTYGDSAQRGYSLQNGGYYFAISDHLDLAVLGDYYTNGSHAMRFESNYAKRYRFRGNVNVRFENLIQSERGFPDYAKTRIYNIQWSHAQDAKSNPNSRFSASVNLGSSQYFRQSINQVNIGSSQNNTLSSTVSYNKTFNTLPQVNLSLGATHQQNANTEEITMTLPNLQASVDRIFPFAPRDGQKKGALKNINLQYSLQAKNEINTTDDEFFTSEMFRNSRTGFQHSIPISTNFKLFKYFSATSTVNYQEVWYLNTVRKFFDTQRDSLITERIDGFDGFRTYSFSQSLGTTIYGTFNFGEDKKIKAIRHVMRPSVSYSYTPSFDQYYDTYDLDGNGTIRDYTRFEGGIYGAPGRSYANLLGLTLNNVIEAKVTDRDSTKTEPKKIILLNNFNFSTSYNLVEKLWSQVRVTGGTLLFKERMNVNFGASLDPYAIDNSGNRLRMFNIDNGGSLFRLTQANLTVGYSLSSTDYETKNKKGDDDQGVRNGGREDDLFGTNTDFSDRRESQFNEDEETEDFPGFFNAKLPWNLTLAYSLTYGNARRENQIVGNSLMVSANTDLTPKWKVGVSSGYDFVRKGVTFTQLRFERDLLSWRMDFNWAPYGDQASWNFFIGIKSGMLSDIKWEKRNQPVRVIR